jgi:hypothetical protein
VDVDFAFSDPMPMANQMLQDISDRQKQQDEEEAANAAEKLLNLDSEQEMEVCGKFHLKIFMMMMILIVQDLVVCRS